MSGSVTAAKKKADLWLWTENASGCWSVTLHRDKKTIVCPHQGGILDWKKYVKICLGLVDFNI